MRIGKSVYHASRNNTGNNTKPTYDTPNKIITRPNYFTVMPATSRGLAEFTKYGEKANDTWTAIANGRVFEGFFKVGDLMWVDGATPVFNTEDEFSGVEDSANAKVVAVNEIKSSISIVLQRK